MRFKEPSLIKLLVKRAGTNKFLRAPGKWTRRAEAAFNFPNILNAIHTCLAHGLKDVELILRYKGDRNDRCYPLP